MFKRKLLSTAVAILGGLFAASAMANPDTEAGKAAIDKSGMEKHQDLTFANVDQNGDGYVSEAELQEAAGDQVSHDTLDADNDGQVNRTEFAAFERMNMQKSATESRYETNPAPTPAQDPVESGSDY